MSTISEQKQQDSYSGKDDQKQQAALNKKQTKQTDAPVDSGSSLVGGTINAVQNAVDRGINMLPASLQDKAHTLEEQAKLALHKASDLAAPVVESYQHDGIIAAAKTATHVGKEAATSAAATLKAAAIHKKDEKAELKGDKKDLKADLKDKKEDLKADAKDAKDSLKADAKDAKTDLKAKKEDLKADAKDAKADLRSKKEDLKADAKDAKDNLKAKAAPAAEKLNAKKEELKGDAKAAKENLKAKATPAAGKIAELQQTATGAVAGLQAQAIALKDQAIAAGMNLKERVLPSGEKAADAAAPKKHGRRRRGGRGHGNRKLKTRVLAEKDEIVAEVSEKAAEAKEAISETAASASAASSGLVSNIRANVSNLATGATEKVQQLKGSAQQILTESKQSNKLERKPSLQRRDELPALGTPMSPDATITETRDGKLAAKPADQSSLLDKAKFAVGGVVEATRDFVADKLDNLSMNGDDTKPLDKSDRAALKQANAQMDNLKAAVAK